MRSELEQVVGRPARWRFSLGCVWAAIVIRARSRERGGEALRALVLAGIVAGLVLVAYGVVRYPGLRSGVTFWISIAVFLAVIAGYGVAVLLLSRGTSRRASLARRYGVIGGIAVGAAWFAVLEPTPGLKGLVFIPLAVTLLGPAAVAVLAARAARSSSAGTLAALWTALVGGLVVFAVWVTVTYVNEGRPYDAGLVRDFHSSGAPRSRDLRRW